MRPCRAAALLAAGVLLAAGCGDDSPDDTPATPTRRPLVVDTDGGADDAMALLYLLQHPAVEVRAITVTGTGIVHCDAGVANVAGLVELAAPGATIPVACGSEVPTEGERAFPDPWREQADERYGDILPAGTAAPGTRTAVAVLRDVLEQEAAPVTVLTLGPLTNLAEAFADTPTLVDEIDEVVVMGGAFDAPGNVFLEDEPEAEVTEWNIYVDPAAAQAVLDSGVPVTFVPLDSQVPVDPYVVRALALDTTSAPAETIARLLGSDPFYVSGQFFFWDPLAAAAVTEPGFFAFGQRHATVVTDGPQAGRTLLGEGQPVTVATALRGDDFVDEYVGTLDGRAGPVTVSRQPDSRITAGDGCRLSVSELVAGPSVLALDTPGAAAAVGSVEPGRADEEINAYLAGSPTGPPAWFQLRTLIQAGGTGVAAYADLEPGALDVVCFGMSDGGTVPLVSGRATLTVSAPS